MEVEGTEQNIILQPEGMIVGAVTSVNGQTGDVVLTTSDLENTSDYQTGQDVQDAIAGKQDKLTAGNNIQISEQNVISATNTTYSAGNGVNISGENAISVDTTVVATQQNLSDEVTNRENADIYLQGQIDAISASSDVVDIVGTYAELQAYDTQHLKDNDIIKVLQDETQGNATTYYRWSTHTQTFTLIGQEGPYYTKAGADAQFVPQTRTVNSKALSANITLTASDVGALGSSDVVQTTGTSTSQVMSQNAVTNELNNKLNVSDYVVEDHLANSTNPVQNQVLNGLLGNMPSDFFSGSATTTPTASTEVQFGNILNLDDVQLLGDTLQQTTTGKNLIDSVPATNTMPDKTQMATFNTVYDSTLGRNVLHASGTDVYPYIGFTLPNRLTSGKYYAFMIKYRTLTTTTGDIPSDAKNFRMYPGRNNIYSSNTTIGTGRIKDESGASNIRLYDTQTYLTRCIRFYADPDIYAETSTPAWYTGFSISWVPAGISGNISAKEIWIDDIQIYEISQTDWDSNNYTGTNFEKYTGGIPAPNPDYPQDIQVVTGGQTVTISDGVSSQSYEINLGKNLYNSPDRTQTRYDLTTAIANNKVTVNGTASRNNFGGTYFNVNGTNDATGNYYNYDNTTSGTTLPAGTYTLSVNNVAGSYITPSAVQLFVTKVYSGSYPIATLATITLTNNQTSATFTLAEETTVKIQFRVAVSSDTSVDVPVFDNYSFNLQLEQGSQVTPYAPYFTPIELCKIGDYQDYIYKSGDDWYVHKAVGKFVNNNNLSFNAENPNRLEGLTPNVGIGGWSTEELGEKSFCNMLQTKIDGTTQQFDGLAGSYPTGRIKVSLSKARATTIQEMNTVLDGMVIYFPFATTTDTKITDATLISELEALLNASTYDGETDFVITATGTNLPAPLQLTAVNANAKGIIYKMRG